MLAGMTGSTTRECEDGIAPREKKTGVKRTYSPWTGYPRIYLSVDLMCLRDLIWVSLTAWVCVYPGLSFVRLLCSSVCERAEEQVGSPSGGRTGRRRMGLRKVYGPLLAKANWGWS